MHNDMTAHAEWANRPKDERYESLAELHLAVAVRDKKSREDKLDLAHVETRVSKEEFAFHSSDHSRKQFTTNWSTGQFMTKLGLQRDLPHKIELPLFDSVIKNRITRYLAAGEEREINTLVMDTNGGTILRALSGPSYERIWDHELTQMTLDGKPDGWRNPVAYADGEWGAPMKPSGLYASDRDVFMFLIDGGDCLDLGERAQLHLGFYAWNSEVGSRSFGFSAFAFNRVCGNNIIWGQQDLNVFRFVHGPGARDKGFKAYGSFLQGLRDAPGEARDRLAQAVKLAQNELLFGVPAETDVDKQKEAIKFFREKGNFTRHQTKGAMKVMWEEEHGALGTRWDWLQGFTGYARKRGHQDNREELDKKAAKQLLTV